MAGGKDINALMRKHHGDALGIESDDIPTPDPGPFPDDGTPDPLGNAFAKLDAAEAEMAGRTTPVIPGLEAAREPEQPDIPGVVRPYTQYTERVAKAQKAGWERDERFGIDLW